MARESEKAAQRLGAAAAGPGAVLLSNRREGPDLWGVAEAMRPLADLCLSPEAETPFALALVGAPGAGKSFALRRLVEAVGIFGRGRVNTGIVGGVETATPHGFASEDDALAATLEEADDLASQGVSTVHCVWGPTPGSVFFKQKVPSLEYYVRLSQGLDQIRRNHGLNVDMDNYRLCGNHPDSDLSRI